MERKQACARCAEQTAPLAEIQREKPEHTRIDWYLAQLPRTAPYFPPTITDGVFDGFYAKFKFVEGVCALGYQVISKLRADADLRYLYEGPQKRRGRRRLFDGTVSFHDLSRFEPVETEEPHLTLYTQVVWSVSLQRRVRVVVAVHRKERQQPRFVVLFSTATELAAADIFRFYKAWFQIEFIFRDAKQCAGFSECQARDKEALHVHFNAAVTVVNLARILAQEAQPREAKLVFSMSSIKQRFFNEHLLNLIISKLAIMNVVRHHG